MSNINIPESVISIESNAFAGCGNLTTINIPKSVKNIGYGAFNYCDKLLNINYAGTEEEWNKIEISYGNEILEKVEINYNAKQWKGRRKNWIQKGKIWIK